jgi:hypothetical protein
MFKKITPEILKNIDSIKALSQADSFEQSLINNLIQELKPDFSNCIFTDDVTLKIQEIFEARWIKFIDTSNDYTINQTGLNLYWIQLAQALSIITDKTYLEFLFPSVKNKSDFQSARELVDCGPLSNFFLLDDGVTLGCVDSLDDARKKKNGCVCIVEKNDNGELIDRHLSLKELHRVLAKIPLGKTHSSSIFAHSLRQNIMRGWKGRGSIPRAILPLLIELLHCYFEEGQRNGFSTRFADYTGFPVLLTNLTNQLKILNLHDVYHFYGCVLDNPISPENPGILLCELLMKWVYGNFSKIKPKMESLVSFISSYDPSFIVQSQSLNEIYRRHGIGVGFSLDWLKNCLSELLKGASPAISIKLNELSNKIKRNSVSIVEAVLELKQIYVLRWSEVKGTILDYTRKQDCGNLWWIRTAQIICGAKLLKNENYYDFLIPTLVHMKDIFTLYPLVNYPLNHCVLSDDEKYLIILDNSEKHYNQTKLFYNCSVNPPVPFTPKEEARLAFAHQHFHQYISLIRNDQLPLKKSSVLIFKDLVESTLDERGLDPLMVTDEDQVLMAGRGFMLFHEALKKLPKDELARINDHRTYFRGTNFSVRELLFKIQRGEEDGCVATCVKIFAQLVINHGEHFKFTQKIENSHLIGVSFMRTNSSKKVFSDYDHITKDEAIRRNNILMISLLTHDFNYTLSGYKLLLWDQLNRGDAVVQSIFNQLKPYIESNTIGPVARYTYVNLIEGSVLKLKAKQGFPSSLSAEIRNWLNLIETGELFNLKSKTVTCFEPKQLFVGLSSFQEHESYGLFVRPFLQDLINTLIQVRSDSMKIVRANVAFLKFIQNFEQDEQSELFKAINMKQNVSLSAYYDSVFSFLVLQASASITNARLFSFFTHAVPNVNYRDLLLQRKPKEWAECHTISDILALINKNFTNTPQLTQVALIYV